MYILPTARGPRKLRTRHFVDAHHYAKIVIPPAIRRIKDQAFEGCMIVTNTVDATI
jgi:hypothetical protein